MYMAFKSSQQRHPLYESKLAIKLKSVVTGFLFVCLFLNKKNKRQKQKEYRGRVVPLRQVEGRLPLNLTGQEVGRHVETLRAQILEGKVSSVVRGLVSLMEWMNP